MIMNLGDLPTVAIMLVVAGITIAVLAYTMGSIQTSVTCTLNTSYSQCNTGNLTHCCIEFPNIDIGHSRIPQYTASNATQGLGTLSSWLPTVAIVAAAAIIIGVVITSLMFRREGQ